MDECLACPPFVSPTTYYHDTLHLEASGLMQQGKNVECLNLTSAPLRNIWYLYDSFEAKNLVLYMCPMIGNA